MRNRDRSWNRDEDMGGSGWSGASGRGGMRQEGYGDESGYGPRASWGGQREHSGFSNYAGGGRRDRNDSSEYGGYGAYGADRGPHYGKGPKNYRRSDARIFEDVCDAIAEQGYVDASDVEVKVEDCIVVLTGTVGERQDKRTLEQIAERIRGVVDVHNELRVRRAEAAKPPPRERPRDQGPASNGRSARS